MYFFKLYSLIFHLRLVSQIHINDQRRLVLHFHHRHGVPLIAVDVVVRVNRRRHMVLFWGPYDAILLKGNHWLRRLLTIDYWWLTAVIHRISYWQLSRFIFRRSNIFEIRFVLLRRRSDYRRISFFLEYSRVVERLYFLCRVWLLILGWRHFIASIVTIFSIDDSRLIIYIELLCKLFFDFELYWQLIFSFFGLFFNWSSDRWSHGIN